MITQNEILNLFSYNDGKLFWKIRKSRNTHIGDEVGSMRKDGYRKISIDGKQYLTHRLIYLYHHGYIPKEIDHIDCDKTNNRIENLRDANGQNTHNVRLKSTNKSGVKGVYWCNTYKRWSAHCWVKYKNYNLGYYDNLKDAEKVVREFREKYHGEFANDG